MIVKINLIVSFTHADLSIGSQDKTTDLYLATNIQAGEHPCLCLISAVIVRDEHEMLTFDSVMSDGY